MKSFKLMVLLLSVSSMGLYETTHAESLSKENNAAVTANNDKENKTIIELNKDITVNTGFNLNKTLAELNGTKDSNMPKVRKVTPVDNDSLERKSKAEVKAANNVTEEKIISPTTVVPLQETKKILTEAGVLDIKVPVKNVTGLAAKEETKAAVEKSPSTAQKSITSNKPDASATTNSKNNTEVATEQDKNSNTTTVTTKAPLAANTSTELIKPTSSVATSIKTANITSTVATPISRTSKIVSDTNTTSTTTTATTTTTTTTSTTTTTTPKPKKPTVTYSIPDFPDLEKDNPDLKNLLQSSASSTNKLPIPDGPYAQPSQEFNNSSYSRGSDIILPIVSMIFIIPLVIGILITSYRRFRDCWSTRHYRRMDFLVDGMYND